MKRLKIAVVHDDFIQYGGAEFLVLDLLKELKKNPNLQITVFSSIISSNWKSKIEQLGISYVESFLSKVPFSSKISKIYFFSNLFYLAFESFDFSEFDIVFSSSTRFGHSVITNPNTLHISYINSPSKALWEVDKYFYGKKFLYNLIKNFLPQKRVYDYVTQQRSDLIISNSKNILKKISKIYQRNSLILHPFKDLNFNTNSKKENYFVLVSRIIPWKRIDYVIEAFNSIKENLIIIGKGDSNYLDYLKSISKENITFLGFIANDEKYQLISKAKGLIVSQDEDFGLVIVEALSLGTPIIYYNKGGAKEILSDEFGQSFDFQNSGSLVEAINTFNHKTYSTEKLKNYSLKFTSGHFIERLNEIFRTKM